MSFIVYYVYFYANVGGATSVSLSHWNMAYISLTITTNVVGTLLVIIRIVRVTGVGCRTYAVIIEILVESSLLYSVTSLVYLALYVFDIYGPYVSETNWFSAILFSATVSYLIESNIISGSLLTFCQSVHCSRLNHGTCCVRKGTSQ